MNTLAPTDTLEITQDHRDLALFRAFEIECETGEGILGDYQRLIQLGWTEMRNRRFEILPAGE